MAERAAIRWHGGFKLVGMVVRAVVFDYFGTLTASRSVSASAETRAEIAAALGIQPEPFDAEMSATFTERATGQTGGVESSLHWLAQRLGEEPAETALQEAGAIRRRTERSFAEPRPEAIPVLRALRGRGLRVGVLSDCTYELVEAWPLLPIAPHVDATVFSVLVGERKPHPRLYARIRDQLGVAAGQCLYVGDGGSNELTGARTDGMRAIHLHARDAVEALVYDRETDWEGETISCLADVLQFVPETPEPRQL